MVLKLPEPKMQQMMLAEFLGTYMLVFTVGCNVLAGNAVWGGASIACVLMVMIYALGGISGAHFNPAVSFAVGVSHLMNGPGCAFTTAGLHICMQLLGSAFGAVSYRFMFDGAFLLQPGKGFGWLNAGIVEMFYTCMLCFVVLNCAVAQKAEVKVSNEFYGIAIGFVIIAGAYGGGVVSGGCFNPAVAFGIDVAGAGFSGVGWCIVYVLCELVGATLAVGMFLLVRPQEFDHSMFGQATVAVPRQLAAEFIGTFFLVFTVGLNVLGSSPAGAFSIAGALMAMVYSLGDVSGAHFNPAVSVAVRLSGYSDDMTVNKIAAYTGAQFFGAASAAAMFTMVYLGKTFTMVPDPHKMKEAVSAEFLFTFVLCYVVLCVAVSPRTADKEIFGLAIGMCITVGGFAIGAISGGSLNPAVTFGIVCTRGFVEFNAMLSYWVAEIAGGMTAAFIFKGTHKQYIPKDNSWEGADEESEETPLLKDEETNLGTNAGSIKSK